MRKDKDIAHVMRMQGKSYSQIYAQLNIPKSTLSDWFRYMQMTIHWLAHLYSSLNIVDSNRIEDEEVYYKYVFLVPLLRISLL